MTSKERFAQYESALRQHKNELKFPVTAERLACIARLQEDYGVDYAVVVTDAGVSSITGKSTITAIEVWFTPKDERSRLEAYYWADGITKGGPMIGIAPEGIPIVRHTIDESRPHVKSKEILLRYMAQALFLSAVDMQRGEKPSVAFIMDVDSINRGLCKSKQGEAIAKKGIISGALTKPAFMWAVKSLNGSILKLSARQWGQVANETIFTLQGGKFYKGKW